MDIYPGSEAMALAKILLMECLGFSNLELYGGKDKQVFKKDLDLLDKIIGRLKNYEPIQYIIGKENFEGLDFEVCRDVLIPRPETAELVEWIIHDMAEKVNCRMLDIGTGSGCIAVTLAKRLKNSVVEAWDISEDALRVAQTNALKNGVEVRFYQKDILCYKPLDEECWDVIVSNPPYITMREQKDMEANVLNWEPHNALFVPDNDPFLFYRKISEAGLSLLSSGGAIYFEINRLYGKEIIDLLSDMGYVKIELCKDMSGNDRMVKALKP